MSTKIFCTFMRHYFVFCRHPFQFPIIRRYRQCLRRRVAPGAGVVFPDNQPAHWGCQRTDVQLHQRVVICEGISIPRDKEEPSMKRNREKKDRAKSLPSAVDNISAQVPDSDNQRSEVQLKPIDAIYLLDDSLEPIAVKPVLSGNQPVPFDPDDLYRVYFDPPDAPRKTDDDHPHADIFCQSDGQTCIEYNFIPTATPAEVERLELIVKTRGFQRLALKRWGGFKLIWGGPGNNEAYDVGANMLLYYDNQIAFVTLRRVGVTAGMTFVEVMSDYLFLRDVHWL
jgi:hypothetical protein